MSDVPHHQEQQPGIEHVMNPQPIEEQKEYKACGKLQGKKALITGGDSGIGRAVAILYAKEGADVSIVYYNEHIDAKQGRAGEPAEIAPSWVFLASDESSYMTGQVLHPNGGTIVNG